MDDVASFLCQRGQNSTLTPVWGPVNLLWLRLSQLRSRPSPSRPHSLERTESRLPTLSPAQQAASTREVHLFVNMDSSAVLHPAYLVDFVSVPSLVPWYIL